MLVARVRESLAETEARADHLRQRISVLCELAGDQETLAGRADEDNVVRFPEHATEPEHGYLRGQEIRRTAVRLLGELRGDQRPIHYAEWFTLLQEAGYGISGRDPSANFLTQVGRSPVVVRSDEPGTYLLDLAAPKRLREQLDTLNTELLALHNGQQTIEEIASARERRNELVAAITRIERALEEALDSLGPIDR